MTAISTSSTYGITLTAPTYVNPVVIDPGVAIDTTVGAALYGSAGTAWTVDNAGTIASTDTSSSGAGINLASGGSVTNQSNGTISGFNGIYGQNGAVTVVNAGLIEAFGTPGSGIDLRDGGWVSNGAMGTISAVEDSGVYITGAAGTIFNAGAILNTGGTHNAIDLFAGGYIYNARNGTISSSNKIAIEFTAATGMLINAGVITTVGGTHAAVDMLSGGYIGNAVGGMISSAGGSGIYMTGGPVTVANAGTISASYSPGIYITGVGGTIFNSGAILNTGGTHNAIDLLGGGYINNAQAGTIISSNKIAIEFTAATGTLINAGVIMTAGGTHAAVDMLSGGYIGNAVGGTISAAGSSGIYLTGGAATVVNAGRIVSGGAHADGILFKSAGTVINTGTIDGSTVFGSAAAVALELGGYVGNAGNGTIITNGGPGVYITGALGTVVNSGSIINFGNAHTGVDLAEGGYLGNAGTISAESLAVYFQAKAGTVVNAGKILANETGANFAAGGTITNLSTGTISGDSLDGTVFMRGGGGTIVNDGQITGMGQFARGVDLLAGGYVGNTATGSISSTGYGGLYISGGAGTVVNAGTISARDSAVVLQAGFTNRVVVDPGGLFSGTVDGGNAIVLGAAVVSTLELAPGMSDGTLSGLGSQFVNFQQTTIDANARWTLTSSNYLAVGTTLTNSGVLILYHAIVDDPGVIVGGFMLDPSTLTVGALIGTGDVTIDSGSTLITQGTVSAGETIAFVGGSGELDLSSPGFSGEISGFDSSDRINLTGVTDATSATIVNHNTLQIERSANPPIDFTLDPNQDYTGTSFDVGPDGAVTTPPVCFLAGSQIATPRGEVPVERLVAGDSVITVGGSVRPIVWIGTGRVLATRGRRSAATPVIVRKGALGDNVPYCDLRITKAHALSIDGVLIPVEFLVNHRSILWDDHAGEVTIYHIELETHDVLLANGVPAESYRDDGNRWLFQNANSGWGLPAQEPCAPVLTGGAVVDAIWHRLLERAGPRPGGPMTDDADLHLTVDGIRVDVTEQVGAFWVFQMPVTPSVLCIVSRAAAPAEMGLARDPRVLGVAVRGLVVRKGTKFDVVNAEDSRLSRGFHAFEAERGWRWTDGEAIVPNEMIAGFAVPFEVVLYVGGLSRYPADGPVRDAA